MSIHSLMFGWEYPPLHLGGLGVACHGLVQGLLKNGVRVTLVLPHSHDSSGEEYDVLSPTEKHLESVRVRSMLSPYITHDQYLRKITAVSKEMQQVYGSDLPQAVAYFTEASVELTKDVNADVVHCHDWMTYGAGMRAAAYHHRPLVTHIHATELDRTHFHPNQWIYDMERHGFEAADCIIAVSNYTKGILTQHYGIAADKIRVVHNGSDDEIINQARYSLDANLRRNDCPMVLFLGRMTVQKGPLHFLEMAAKVHGMRPDVQFVMAGEGGMLDEAINRACDLGLKDCTVFTGKVNSREAKKLYQQADCFVMPSLSEPFGLVALEAIANGTPVVVSKQSGVSEVVAHGFTVDFWDTDKMADCVLTILRENPLALQLKSEAPKGLRHMRWEHQARNVRSIYSDLITS